MPLAPTDPAAVLRAARADVRADGGPFAVHAATPAGPAEPLAAWLLARADAADARGGTLRLAVEDTAGSWLLTATTDAGSRPGAGADPTPHGDAGRAPDAAHATGDALGPPFRLDALDALCAAVAEHSADAPCELLELVDELMVALVVDQVDRALALTPGRESLPVVLSRPFEPRVAAWGPA